MTRAATEQPDATPEADPPAGAPPPPVDRRLATDRRALDRRTKQLPVDHDRRSGKDRRHEERRASSEVEDDAELLEFLRAIHDFKERTGKAFPAWSDVLRIVRDLGYEKRS